MGEEAKPPKLVKRREHKNSSFMAGRTIGEKREKLETANERAAARRKDKNKKAVRIIITIVGLLTIIGILILLLLNFVKSEKTEPIVENSNPTYVATIPIVDEATNSDEQITSRMRDFVGQVENDLKDYGIKVVKAVVPTGAIRQVNFFLEGYNGYVKMIVDRGAGVSAEDTYRMLKYLESIDIKDFEYIDVRIEGKAYWK